MVRTRGPSGWGRAARRAAVGFALVCMVPGDAGATDARTGDAEAIGGRNIAELREEIIDERLSCAGGEASPWWAAGVAIGAVVVARRRRAARDGC